VPNGNNRPVCLAALLVALLLTGCAAKAPPLASGTVVAGRAPMVPEHTLTAGDEFEIRFPFAPEFNDKVTVGVDGTVAPKLIGGVVVGGLTVPEATARLGALYVKKIRATDVSLTVRQYAPEVFYVDGAVKKPGLIRSALPLTVTRAVAEAGGAKIGALTGEILVIRRDAAGNVQAYKSPLAPAEGGVDPILKSFDVIYVPLSPIGSVNQFMSSYVRNLPFAATYNVVPVAPALQLTPGVTTAPR
jgi:protein involved in polysaccharide export with SLBB domain